MSTSIGSNILHDANQIHQHHPMTQKSSSSHIFTSSTQDHHINRINSSHNDKEEDGDNSDEDSELDCSYNESDGLIIQDQSIHTLVTTENQLYSDVNYTRGTYSMEKSIDTAQSVMKSGAPKKSDSKGRVRYGWETMYKALLAFGEEHGHYNVPRRYIQKLPEGTKSPDDGKTILMNATLGGWLTTQRIEKANGRLKSEREALLQYLCNQGKFDWNPPNKFKESSTTWPYMFRCLVDYCDNKLATYPPGKSKSVPEKLKWPHPETKQILGLGRWVHTQNKRRRENKLRPDRLQLMEELAATGKFAWAGSGNSRMVDNAGWRQASNRLIENPKVTQSGPSYAKDIGANLSSNHYNRPAAAANMAHPGRLSSGEIRARLSSNISSVRDDCNHNPLNATYAFNPESNMAMIDDNARRTEQAMAAKYPNHVISYDHHISSYLPTIAQQEHHQEVGNSILYSNISGEYAGTSIHIPSSGHSNPSLSQLYRLHAPGMDSVHGHATISYELYNQSHRHNQRSSYNMLAMNNVAAMPVNDSDSIADQQQDNDPNRSHQFANSLLREALQEVHQQFGAYNGQSSGVDMHDYPISSASPSSSLPISEHSSSVAGRSNYSRLQTSSGRDLSTENNGMEHGEHVHPYQSYSTSSPNDSQRDAPISGNHVYAGTGSIPSGIELDNQHMIPEMAADKNELNTHASKQILPTSRTGDERAGNGDRMLQSQSMFDEQQPPSKKQRTN